jgi:CheY-like chemotaxis protein
MQASGEEVSKRDFSTLERERHDETFKTIKGARVLVVEDNEINQQVAQEILQGAGVVVSIASNGREAVDAVKEEDYDAVLMDIQMPVLDGYAATKEIRKWEVVIGNRGEAPIPIIAMTAHAMAGDREKSLESGMNDHVSKPIDPQMLLRTLKKWIGERVGAGSDRDAVEVVEEVLTIPVEEAAEFPHLDGINTEVGLNRLLGNPKTYLRILLKFHKDFVNAAEAIRSLVSQGHYDEAQRLTHSIKGAGGNIGGENLQEAAAALERKFRGGGKGLPEPEYTEFSKELKRVFTSLSALVEKECADEAPQAVALPQEIAKEIAERLRKAVDLGDITELSEIAQSLSAEGGASSIYGEKIARLAAEFDLDGLTKLANSLDETNPE